MIINIENEKENTLASSKMDVKEKDKTCQKVNSKQFIILFKSDRSCDYIEMLLTSA